MTAQELKALRHSLDITQTHMALLAKVGKRTVQFWEHGHHPIPEDREALIRSAARRLQQINQNARHHVKVKR